MHSCHLDEALYVLPGLLCIQTDRLFKNDINTNLEEEEEEEEEEEKKLTLFMKRIINVQQMIRCKGVLLRKDCRIINLLLFSGLQEDGPS